MKLIVITSSKKDDDEVLAIIKMFEAGLSLLHVRKPRFSTKELSDYLKSIPDHFHDRIVIHSHHRLAGKFNLHGIHYTNTHLKKKFRMWWTTKLAVMRNPRLIKTVSYKRISDVYLRDKVNASYCFIGTMFHNITGSLYSGFYPEAVFAANQKSGKKLVARGGINEKSVELAHQLGFYGVALYGHLWKSTEPFNKYLAFVKFCKEKGIPLE